MPVPAQAGSLKSPTEGTNRPNKCFRIFAGLHWSDDHCDAKGASGGEHLAPVEPDVVERGHERGGRLRRAKSRRVSPKSSF